MADQDKVSDAYRAQYQRTVADLVLSTGMTGPEAARLLDEIVNDPGTPTSAGDQESDNAC